MWNSFAYALCHRYTSWTLAHVACRQLGYDSGRIASSGVYGVGETHAHTRHDHQGVLCMSLSA